jgi:flavin reductase (DIM6/NTAB) family NADH-FMN oxidoreductase RutF
MAKSAVPLGVASRLLEPGPLLLLSAQHHDRMTVSAVAWSTVVSRDPLLVGVALHPSRWSFDLIRDSQVFVLNIPHWELVRQVHLCGTVSGRDQDKFAACGFHPVVGSRVECPLIEECIGHLECGLVDIWSRGDHHLVIGEVVAAWADEGLFDETWDLPEEVQLIHHFGGAQYGRLGAREEVGG